MILYHGSNTKIEKIDLSICRPFKDFGQGFYLTDIKHQATRMAARKTKIYKGEPTVSAFEFDFDKAIEDGLNIKIYESPNEEWARFVMMNRDNKLKHPCHSYDIVVGPVADDTISKLLRMYVEKYINGEQLLSKLAFTEITVLYFFHTEASLKYLKQI